MYNKYSGDMQGNRLFKIVYDLIEKRKSTTPKLAEKFKAFNKDYKEIGIPLIPPVFRLTLYKEKEELYHYCRILFWTISAVRTREKANSNATVALRRIWINRNEKRLIGAIGKALYYGFTANENSKLEDIENN